MLKLLGMGFAAERRLFGGGSEGGGGSAEPAQRSSADVQNDINAALDASGGAWTSELNTLVSEREAAKATESAAPPPATKVENTAGLSVRVNSSSENPYQVVNEQGYTVFSSSSEDRAKGYVEENTFDEYLDARGTAYATKKEADAANKDLFAASEREASREADAYFKSVVAGTAPKSTGTVIGAVSPQGTYAGDGFEWKQTSSGALTRVYTGANADRGLGTETISAGETSDIGLKNAIAKVSLDEGSSFAYSPISATDANLFSLILTGDSGRSASYADQIGAPASPAAAAGPTGTDFTGSGGFNAAFRDAREALGPGQTFTYGGQQYSTATAEERPDLAGPTGGITTLVAGDPRVNMPPGALPAAPVDFSVTTSGRPYDWEAGLSGLYVSGAEAALGPDAGVRYQDLRDTARSYGEDMGVTLPAGTGGLPSRDRPVIDLGEINVRADDLDLPLEFGGLGDIDQSAKQTRVDLAAARTIPTLTQGVGSLVGSLRETFGTSPYGVNIDPETMEPEVFRRPTEPSAAERYLGELTAAGRAEEARIFSELSPMEQERVLAPIITTQAGYDRGQVDPRLAAAAGLDPNELIFNPSALVTQALLSGPSTLLPLGVSLLNPFAGYGLGALMTVGEGGREVSDAVDAAYRSGEVQQSPLYQDLLRQTGGDEAAALAAVKRQVMFTATPLLAGLGAGSTALARNVTNVGGLVTRALGIPAGRTGATLTGAVVEAGTEGLEEGFLEKAAIAEPAKGLTGLDIYPSTESMLGEGAVGALIGGGVGLGMGAVPSEAPFVQTVTPSGPAPFIPAAPRPAPFTPGAGPAATMTVEGTAADVTPGFRPAGPTVGQIAQTPPGLLSAYQQAAESLGAAGVRNIGGAPAPGMMDVAAATEIINNEVAETGALSLRTAQNLENATGLGMESIRDIAESAPNVGVPRDNLITDVVTGTGGGGQIQVTANRDGSHTLRNLTTGNPQHVATVEAGQSLDEAIKVFDEVTTVGSPEAITVDTAGIASLPPTDPRLNIPPGSLPAAETTPAAEPTTALVPSGPATTTTQTGVTPRTTTEALTGIGTTGTSGIGSLTTVGAGTQLDVAQPVDLTATPAETAEIIEFTPTEDVIEGTAVEIAGQIPGTVATTTTPATTETTATTTVPSETFVFAEEPPDEEDGVLVDIEDEGPVTDAGEEGVEVAIPPEVQATDEEEEAPFECPEGYTAVKMAGRWVCQKTETTMVGRPTVGTRPYLSKVGFAGPSPRPQQLTTRTRTVTAAE
jgi:hypothetical protein